MTKIDIISGFLGAGKTTLIKRLLATHLHDEKVILIENEFGEIGIDAGFLKETKVEIKELNQGCICCSLQGDFATALTEIKTKYNPTRIIIEPSGVGKLSDIVKAVVDANLSDVKLNALVCVCDANKAKMYLKNFGEFYVDQVAHAKTIFLSRADVATEAKMQECLEIVREINDKAIIVTTPINELSDGTLIDSYEAKNDDFEAKLLEEVKHMHHHHHDDEECECGHHHHDHDADEVFTSYGFETTHKYSHDELEAILHELSFGEKYGFILRSKGIVAGIDGWYHFDMVPEETNVRHGEAASVGKICVIGSKLNKEEIKKLFIK
ncbi:cobW/P47K family protein [Clostridium sp. CAG:307]|nr:cobW/P47K family protein [Clostridium sp. CAG:307]